MAKKKSVLLACGGLKYKLRIAVYLMSILPLLVCIYLASNYIFPRFGFRPDIIVSIGISACIAVFGFFMVKEIFDSVQSVSCEAKLIASGDLSRTLDMEREDEVGDLANSLNKLTEYIRNNMNELENYSDKTNKINLEIQKRVFLLSNLLQISSLVSQGVKFEDVLKVVVEKSRLMADSEIAYLLLRNSEQGDFYMKLFDGAGARHLAEIKIIAGEEIFEYLAENNKPLVLDKNNSASKKISETFYDKFKIRNSILMPIYLKRKLAAILGIGNNDSQFFYKKEDVELLDIFAKQLAIAMENDILVHRVEKLEIKDTLTGLYNEAFIQGRLQEEIKRAIINRKPCAFIIFDIDNFQAFHQRGGSLKMVEDALKKISSLIVNSVTEIDRVARFGDDAFAVVLPNKSKRQAYEVAEDIRKKIEFVFSEEDDPNKRLTISGGVSENPLDGITADELMAKAKELLKSAKAQGKNRIL